MKKIIFLTAILSMSATASAANAGDNDTVVIIGQPNLVKIVDNGNRKSIEVIGRNGDDKFRYVYTSEVNDTSDISIIDGLFAFNAPMARKARNKTGNRLSLDTFRDIYSGAIIPVGASHGFGKAGWEIGMLNVFSAVWHYPAACSEISVGLGWWYRRMPVSDGMMIDGDNRGNITLVPVGAGYNAVKSHVRAFGLSIPVTYFCRLSGKFGVEVGGVMQLNTYTRAAVSSWEGNVEHKYNFKGMHQRILTADALIRVGIRGTVAVYALYSPMPMFASGHGLSTSHISVGLSLGF